jgi:hypothetical protein
VLFHSLLFIVPEAQVWKKRFSLLNLVFISLLTVNDNDNDNERTNDSICNKLNRHHYWHYFYFIHDLFLHWKQQYNENQHNGTARKYLTIRFISILK